MDILNQTKLSRSEWESIEIPVTESEKIILNMIQDGYSKVDILINSSNNMITFTKMQPTPEIHAFLFDMYFRDITSEYIEKLKPTWEPFRLFKVDTKVLKKIKSADAIRIHTVDKRIQTNREKIYEFDCMDLGKIILKSFLKKQEFRTELYTLIEWRKACLLHTNPFVMELVDLIIAFGKNSVTIESIVSNSYELIEKNGKLYKYENKTLFPHQKELFSICKKKKDVVSSPAHLILYTAPTGTGKTLSPLGLSNGYKIIFVCVARHVGLALAKSAISIDKKVAFAFGCDAISDIRLHYFSAIDFQKNWKTGGIWKVDHSNGEKVEIMICDVHSYLHAMHYMLAFNEPSNLLTYWDEPTMTLDYEEHPLHKTIKENWCNNVIPNFVLSSATLPDQSEIQDCIQDFRSQFEDAMIHTISSYDCRKSIPMLTSAGYSFMPHLHCETTEDLRGYASFCSENKTLLRYFDLAEIIQYIMFIHEHELIPPIYRMDEWFEDISQITMNNMKLYYLVLLQNTEPSGFLRCRSFLSSQQEKKFTRSSDGPLGGVLLTTRDSYTLTDGPTIYLADNIVNLAKFYVQQSEIPEIVLKQLLDGIKTNESVFAGIQTLEQELEKRLKVKDNSSPDDGNKMTKTKTKTKTKHREKEGTDEATKIIKDSILNLRSQLFHLTLDKSYIPNSREHQDKWSPDKKVQPFTSDLGEQTVKDIMEMKINISYKVLILMGVGVLIKQETKEYEEIVKRLADEQKLFLILTSSDYIYGTNYQFCHGVIGKDLKNMTPQKILQSMGRIGRNKHQQDYTVRFRSDAMIESLFKTPEINQEGVNMNKLFCRD
jgi:hypothetical protein